MCLKFYSPSNLVTYFNFNCLIKRHVKASLNLGQMESNQYEVHNTYRMDTNFIVHK